MTKIVAVFGSARVQPDNEVYKQSYAIGQALAEAGFITMTGGYAGVMEAASKGAIEAKGEAYGVTVASLEYIGESVVNPYVTKEIRYDTLHQRIAYIVDAADAYVVMPGGLGTGQELIEVWQGIRLGDLPEKPIIIYGNFWQPMIDIMLDGAYISPRDMQHIEIAHNAADTVSSIKNWFNKEQS